jgi:hypothetical protein
MSRASVLKKIAVAKKNDSLCGGWIYSIMVFDVTGGGGVRSFFNWVWPPQATSPLENHMAYPAGFYGVNRNEPPQDRRRLKKASRQPIWKEKN